MISESKVKAAIRKDPNYARQGVILFDNPVGATRTENGGFLRYGLFPGSSDLIGWREVEITPEMVGKRVAVFVAHECKRHGERPTESQANFIAQVRRAGGIAGWSDSPDFARAEILTNNIGVKPE